MGLDAMGCDEIRLDAMGYDGSLRDAMGYDAMGWDVT